MQRRSFFSLTALSLLSGAAPSRAASPTVPAPAQWQTAAPLPIQTQELYPCAHQGRLYVAGGIASRLGVPYFSDRTFSFNPASNRWREEARLPEALHHAAMVSTGERLFLVGGFHGSYLKIWQMRATVYELTADGWLPHIDLPEPQAEGVLSFSPDGNIHLVTGQSPSAEANAKRSDHREVTRHLVWRPGDSQWRTRAPIPTPRNSATGGWIGREMVVTGGRTAKGNLSQTEIYCLEKDEWRSATAMPKPQAGSASVVHQDSLIVFGGEIFIPEADVFADVWRYTLKTDNWVSLGVMPTPRHGIGAGIISGRAYVIGGATQPGGKGTSDLNEVLIL